MKRYPLVLLILAGCGTTEEPGPGEVPGEELTYAMMFSTDPKLLKVGQFGIYTCRVQGESQTFTTTLKVTGADAQGLWIEQKVPANPMPFIIKSHISLTGELIESWVGEPRGTPAKTFPLRDERPGPKPIEPADVKTDVTRETITVGKGADARTFDCTKLISTITYKNGKTSSMTSWCSMEAPFPIMKDGQPVGGIVRRQYGRVTVELHGQGDNAKEELVLPKKK